MASRFWVGGTGTWDASTTTNWAATTGGAGGQTVPGSGDTVTFDGSSGGGTVTVNTTVNVTSITCGAHTGTLDFSANNNSVTVQTFSGSGSGTRTLNLGNGIWTVTGTTGTTWTIQTTTGLTFNANSSSIVMNGTTSSGTRAIILGALTYNNITVSNSSANGLLIDFNNSGAFTIGGTLTFTNIRLVRLGTGTSTVTGAITFAGSSTSPAILFGTGGVVTLSVGAANTWDYVNPYGITKSGAGSITITNGFDGGSNTSITITNPAGGVVGHIIGS